MFTVLQRYTGPETAEQREQRELLEAIHYRAGSIFALKLVMESIGRGFYHPVADVLAKDPAEAIQRTMLLDPSEHTMWYRKCSRGTSPGDLLIWQLQGGHHRVFVVLSDKRVTEFFGEARESILENWEERSSVHAM